jgi:hypothetical protein
MRWFVYTLVFATSVFWYFKYPSKLESQNLGQEWRGCDFHIFYEAAKGNFEWVKQYKWIWVNTDMSRFAGYFYPRWTAIVFKPFTLLPFKQSYFIWCLFLASFYVLILKRIFHYVKDNPKIFICTWFAAIISIKFFAIGVNNGNMVPVIGFLLLTPAGCLLAGCFKLWALAFIPVHFLLEVASRYYGGAGKIHRSLHGCSIFNRNFWYRNEI